MTYMNIQTLNGPNLLGNPGFETGGLLPWWKYSDIANSISLVTPGNPPSNYCAYFNVPTALTTDIILMQSNIPVSSANTYILSGYTKAQITTTNKAWIHADWYDATGYIDTSSISDAGGTHGWSIISSLQLSPIRLAGTRTATYCNIYTRLYAGITGQVWVDDLYFGTYSATACSSPSANLTVT